MTKRQYQDCLLFMGDANNIPLDMETNQHARDFMDRELSCPVKKDLPGMRRKGR